MPVYEQQDAGEAPIKTGDVTFKCDYQPTVTNLSVNTAGTEVPVSFILFVPKWVTYIFSKGNAISCNGQNGTISLSVPFNFGTIIYVK